MSVCPHPEKYAHKSCEAALKARESLEAKKGIDLSLRPYHCVCGAWHLGRRDKTGRRYMKTRSSRRGKMK